MSGSYSPPQVPADAGEDPTENERRFRAGLTEVITSIRSENDALRSEIGKLAARVETLEGGSP